jgi:uncharacterized membrane protein
MADALPRAFHILGAVLWLGPQFFMFIAVMPALRAAGDTARMRAMAVLTVRFNYLAWSALALLVLTGLYSVGDRAADFDLFDVRYGFILVVKVAFAAAAILLTALHSFVIGPQLLALQEAAATGGGVEPERIAALRRRSMLISIATLLLGLAIVYMGALLRQTEFSFT